MTGTTDLATIKPNLKSLVNINISTMFNLSRSFSTTSSSTYGLNSNEVDSHMMKNMDWGAVAYLTNSKYGRYLDEDNCIESGCTPWKNSINVSEIGGYQAFTGCSTSKSNNYLEISSVKKCLDNYDWSSGGVNAATTGNIFGIYDMNGGAWEMVMGMMQSKSGNVYLTVESGFNNNFSVESKYYDLYNYSDKSSLDGSRYFLGDATREVMKIKTDTSEYSQNAWYKNQTKYNYDNDVFVCRGGDVVWKDATGIFCFSAGSGDATNWATFRNIITKS